MRKSALFLVFYLILLNAAFVSANPVANLSSEIISEKEKAGYESNILLFLNRERRRNGLVELLTDTDLQKIARSYSEKMAREKFFGHNDLSGATVLTRVKNSKIVIWKRVGENLFFSTSKDNLVNTSVKGWLKSAPHKRNILDAIFNYTGIGIAQSSDGLVYVTQIFMAR